MEGLGKGVTHGRHLLLYDGVCGLCNGAVQAVLARDRRGIFDFAPLQSVTSRAAVTQSGGDPDDLDTIYVIANYRDASSRTLARAAAVLFVMKALGWPWKAAGLLEILPNAVLDRMYDVVARHRYRVFGRLDRCAVPPPEHRARFIEESGDDASTTGAGAS
jgi:predicted DCC family thiol-disulfide oxidoreductase YuxK